MNLSNTLWYYRSHFHKKLLTIVEVASLGNEHEPLVIWVLVPITVTMLVALLVRHLVLVLEITSLALLVLPPTPLLLLPALLLPPALLLAPGAHVLLKKAWAHRVMAKVTRAGWPGGVVTTEHGVAYEEVVAKLLELLLLVSQIIRAPAAVPSLLLLILAVLPVVVVELLAATLLVVPAGSCRVVGPGLAGRGRGGRVFRGVGAVGFSLVARE
jgi:hypothetical protein